MFETPPLVNLDQIYRFFPGLSSNKYLYIIGAYYPAGADASQFFHNSTCSKPVKCLRSTF